MAESSKIWDIEANLGKLIGLIILKKWYIKKLLYLLAFICFWFHVTRWPQQIIVSFPGNLTDFTLFFICFSPKTICFSRVVEEFYIVFQTLKCKSWNTIYIKCNLPISIAKYYLYNMTFTYCDIFLGKLIFHKEHSIRKLTWKH